MSMTSEIYKALDDGNIVVDIFLDFSEAFDTVNHDILLDKLYHYGIRGNAYNWFVSYLSERKQYVTYNNVTSCTKEVSCGVPQGSILGPLLFLLYINDLVSIRHKSKPILFADDTNLFYKGNDADMLADEINNELRQISLWLKINKLSLNIGKTHFMIFTRKKRIKEIEIQIDGKNIEKVNSTKFLGVIIDHKLKWSEHVKYIAGKISRSCGVLNRARRCLNRSAMLTLYYSFVYPYITYCNHVWGSTYPSNTDKLLKLQKRALRIMFKLKRRESTAPLYPKLNILRFNDINIYLISRFLYRYNACLLPDTFSGYFIPNTEIHNYNTRRRHHFHPPLVRSEMSKFGIQYRGAIIWNHILDLGIDTSVSEPIFMKSIKRMLINNKLAISD